MTREEVTICKVYLNDLDRTHDCNEYKLLMELLNREPCEDCVSRKAVLNLANDLDFSKVKGLENYKHRCIEIEEVEQLPPVTPDLSSLREINKALTKRVKYLEDMEKYATPETFIHRDRTVQDFVDKCRECGKQRKGKWIAKENIHGLEKFYKCSNCGNHCLYEYAEIGFKNAKTKYCPSCGAEMTAEENDKEESGNNEKK